MSKKHPPHYNDPRRKWLLGLERAYGLSRAEMSRMLEMPYVALCMMLAGSRRVSDRTVYAIVRRLDVPPPPGMPPPPPIMPRRASEEIRALQQQVQELTRQIAELKRK